MPLNRRFIQFPVLAAVLAAAACSGSRALPENVIGEANRPVTVRIEAKWTGTVDYVEPRVSTAFLQQAWLQARQASFTGQIENTPQARTSAFIQILFSNPEVAFPLHNIVRRQSVEAGSTGTGVVVTPDGFIVTNAHVIAEDPEKLKVLLTRQGLERVITQTLQWISQYAQTNLGAGLSEADQEVALIGLVKVFAKRMDLVGPVTRSVQIAEPIVVLGGSMPEVMVPAQVIVEGQPVPGEDVAILKRQGATKLLLARSNLRLQSALLGDDSLLATGDKVFIMGYPGASTFHPYVAKESRGEATFTSGTVSGRKRTIAGWEAIQTDTVIHYGNSGGPAFNDRGEVIGLATFGSPDQAKGMVQGLNFLVPLTLVRKYLELARVSPEFSESSAAFREGMLLWSKKRYRGAIRKFEQVQQLHPGDYYANKMIVDSKNRIDKGESTFWDW